MEPDARGSRGNPRMCVNEARLPNAKFVAHFRDPLSTINAIH